MQQSLGPELALWSLIASPLVAGGAWAVLTGHGAPGLLLCALGAWSSTPIVLVVSGQVSPGGVWLTPTAVVVRDRGLESRIPWRCLVVVSASGDGSVVLRADASAGMIHRKRSRAWSSGVRTASPSVATVDTRWLALDATALTGLLEHYRRDGCVGELGTHASLVTVAAFSR